MRFKPVPEAPETVETLDRARRAVSLVPDPEADCCARLQDRLALADRDAARAWLAFLRALGLVERTERGYRRTRRTADPAACAESLRERVYGARETLDVVEAEGPVTADGIFDRLRDRVPAWERARDPAWEDSWRERTRRLLDWAALFGLVERTDEGYRGTDRGSIESQT